VISCISIYILVLSNSEQADESHVILLLHGLSEPSVEKYIPTANSERSETTLLRNVKFVKRNIIYEFEKSVQRPINV
jgi:hypothetical protein